MNAPHEHEHARRIELVVQQLGSLPTLPPIAARLLEVASPEDADLDEIVAVVESDPALTARVLGLCRRADKGLIDQVTTVRRAVVLLGLASLQSAVLSICIYEMMGRSGHTLEKEEPARAPAFDRPGFWRHSLAVACAGELIAAEHPRAARRPGQADAPKPEEVFVAGLLHDLGKLALDLILPRTYRRVVEIAERRRCASSAVERELLGLDHHTVGKWLGEHWALPHVLQDAMWLHGQPAASIPDLPHKRLIGMVTIAKALCRELHLGFSGDFGPPGFGAGGARVADLCREFGIDEKAARRAMARVPEAVAQRCALLGLDASTPSQLLMQSLADANHRLGRLNTALERRARASQRQAGVLAAIAGFHAAWQPGRNVADTLGAVVRSAAGVLGEGFFAGVFQGRESDPWRLWQFSPGGHPTRSELIDAPGHGCSTASLSELALRSNLSVQSLNLLPWLMDYLTGCSDIRRVQFLPLRLSGADSDAAPAGPCVLLLHDRDPGLTGLDAGVMAPLVATWAAAVTAAAQHEGARRLGERLADANRALSDAQARLAETQSLARLGEMAAGAAHEMNNPLTVIRGRAELLASSLKTAKDKAAAQAITGAATQLSELITSLKLLADPPEPCPQEVAAERLVHDALARIDGRLAAGRVTVLRERSVSLLVDRELVAMALADVIANALEASADAPVDVCIQIDAADGRPLIVVRDQGPGMSPKALQHAFDPFFSEKPAGRRTGLGLTRARRLIELHGGEVSLASKPGCGATVTIALAPPAAGGEGSPMPEEPRSHTDFGRAA